jgi:hypothetical protein
MASGTSSASMTSMATKKPPMAMPTPGPRPIIRRSVAAPPPIMNTSTVMSDHADQVEHADQDQVAGVLLEAGEQAVDAELAAFGRATCSRAGCRRRTPA